MEWLTSYLTHIRTWHTLNNIQQIQDKYSMLRLQVVFMVMFSVNRMFGLRHLVNKCLKYPAHMFACFEVECFVAPTREWVATGLACDVPQTSFYKQCFCIYGNSFLTWVIRVSVCVLTATLWCLLFSESHRESTVGSDCLAHGSSNTSKPRPSAFPSGRGTSLHKETHI